MRWHSSSVISRDTPTAVKLIPLPRCILVFPMAPLGLSLGSGESPGSYLLVIHKFAMLVNLVFHREVDRGTVHMLTKKYLHFGLVFFILKIPDHIREPNRETIVAVIEKTEYSSSNLLYSFMIRVRIPDLMQIKLIFKVLIWFVIRKSHHITHQSNTAKEKNHDCLHRWWKAFDFLKIHSFLRKTAVEWDWRTLPYM